MAGERLSPTRAERTLNFLSGRPGGCIGTAAPTAALEKRIRKSDCFRVEGRDGSSWPGQVKAGFKLSAVNRSSKTIQRGKSWPDLQRPVMADTALPESVPQAAARRFMGSRRTAVARSDLDLLRDLQGIIDLDAEVTDCGLKLGMAQ